MLKENIKIPRYKIIRFFATCVCVFSPLIATLLMFPLWVKESSEATVSGLFLVFVYLSCLPFVKQIKQYFKNPSAWVVWFVLFALLYIIKCIIMQMIVISAVGLTGNLIGVVLYKIADYEKNKKRIKIFGKCEDDIKINEDGV